MTIRATPLTIAIFGILFSPFLIAGYLSTQVAAGSSKTGVILCLIYLGIIGSFLVLSINIKNGRLIHRSLLGKRVMLLSAVRRVEITANPAPTLRLQGDDRSLDFKIKPYSKSAIIYILKAIREASPTASFDALSETLEKGDFGPLTRKIVNAQTTKARNLIYLFMVIALFKLIMFIF